ncbi:type VII secretion target [Mycobacterium angelicum]|uniref:type VII secretion target n=1 Tax=Mycobacterium angelicum TaxID=470074 RepID=UPI001FECF226|nr:type VII secretion target [Mycobacterium angelicum]
MTDKLRVDPGDLRVAGTAWDTESFGLHAAPPSVDTSGGWPTMFGVAGVTGAAQACTAALHTQITATAAATQIAATGYQATDSDAAHTLKNVVTTTINATAR